MNAPLIWILFPAFLAAAGFFLRRWHRVVTIVLALAALLLAAAARFAPIGEVVIFGPWAFTLSERLVFAGRQFVISAGEQEMLTSVYLLLGFFLVGALPAEVSDWFATLSMGMTAVLVASLAVEPFLYAALFIEIAVLLGVPLLSPPEELAGRGVLRYLTFLSLGMPFMLFAGWQISSIAANTTDPAVLLPALAFLGFGFAFLLAIFPLNSWIPMLSEHEHPYAAAYVILLLPMIVISLLLRFINAYVWLLDLEIVQVAGLLMTVTGGLWATFQRNLGRLLGFALIIEIGSSLLAISSPAGIPIYTAMLAPRILAVGVWALSLARLRKVTDGNLSFRAVKGIGRIYPVSALGVLVGIFSLAGFPFLASFPARLMLLGQLAQISFSTAAWTLLGSAGLLVGGLRTLTVLVMEPDDRSTPENRGGMVWFAQGLIAAGVLGLVILGILLLVL